MGLWNWFFHPKFRRPSKKQLGKELGRSSWSHVGINDIPVWAQNELSRKSMGEKFTATTHGKHMDYKISRDGGYSSKPRNKNVYISDYTYIERTGYVPDGFNLPEGHKVMLKDGKIHIKKS